VSGRTDKRAIVLWGYHPAYAPVPIKLAAGGARYGLKMERKRRERQGFVTSVYRAGDPPEGLRLLVSKLRGELS